MPAALRPYRASLEHTMALIGALTFFIIDVLQLARLLAEENTTGTSQDEQLGTAFAGMVGALLEWQRLVDQHD